MPLRERPYVFVGSSTEGVTVARAVQQNLSKDCDIQVWDQDAFELSGGTLTGLMSVADAVDFAIVVITADDLIISRGAQQPAPKDNVFVEIWLFVGKLGLKRTLIACDETTHLSTYLDSLLRFTDRHTLEVIVPALAPCCNKILAAMTRIGPITKSRDSFEIILAFARTLHPNVQDLYNKHLEFLQKKLYQVVSSSSTLSQEERLQCHDEWNNYRDVSVYAFFRGKLEAAEAGKGSIYIATGFRLKAGI